MTLKAVVLSDLHLGEPGSILFNQRAKGLDFSRDHAIGELAELLRKTAREEDGEEEIEQLILLGDIPDLTLDGSDNSWVSKQNTKDLLSAVCSQVKIGKIVYIPGNHDYHLWVDMVEKDRGSYKTSRKTNYAFIEKGGGWKVDYVPINNNLFEQEYTDKNLGIRVEVAYPIYSLYSDKCFYLFHHGHLTSPLLINSRIRRLKDINSLEDKIYKKILKFWGKYKKLHEFGWKKIVNPFLRFSRSIKMLHPGKVGTLYDQDQLGVDRKELQMNIRWFIQMACEIPSRYFNLSDPDFKFHYIFGHTHYGGRVTEDEKLCWIEKSGQKKYINVWNLGGWLVPFDLFPPYGYIFFIREDWSAGRRLLFSSKFNIPMGFYPSRILALHAGGRSIIG